MKLRFAHDDEHWHLLLQCMYPLLVLVRPALEDMLCPVSGLADIEQAERPLTKSDIAANSPAGNRRE